MNAPFNSPLKQAVEAEHGGAATFVHSVPVFESFRGKTLWNGAVQVFDLTESPSGAARAYAWSIGLPDGQRRSFTVLHGGAIASARDAVRAVVLPPDR
jgi:hypothetical protein